MSDSPAAVLVDENGVLVGVTEDGRLKVEDAPPEAPAGTTEVTQTAVNTLGGNSFSNYDIPVGETLTIQQFIAGAGGEGGKGARVILLYDQGSGEPVQNLEIARIYVQASTKVIALNFTAPRPAQAGARIRIRRTPLEGSTQEVYGFWRGFF